MNLVEISKKYPASYEKMMNTLVGGREENAIAFAVKKLAASYMTARSLLDFFDDYGIHVTTQYIPEKEWYGVVHHGGNVEIIEEFSTRKEAEEQSVLRAFELLEHELT